MGFDWTKVDGYREDMTADEKLALLDNYEAPAPDGGGNGGEPEGAKPRPGYIAKTQYDKLASDFASLKKQLRSRMSDDEQREADRQAEMEAKETELAALRREKTLSMHKASFLSQGYDEALAEEAATAMTDGDMETVFSAMKRFNSANEKALRAQILKDTPVPPAGDDPNSEEAKRRDAAKLRRYFGLS